MILKFSFLALFSGVPLLLPISAQAQHNDVTIDFPGGVPMTGQLEQRQNGLYLDENNGSYYKLAPSPDQLNHQQQEINTLSRQNAKLQSKLSEREDAENHAVRIMQQREESARQAREQSFIAEQHEEKEKCRRLLWQCQLPNHHQGSCENFTRECQSQQQEPISVPVPKPLGETDLLYPAGYFFPDGHVEGAYHQLLGYVMPNDFDSALMMAEHANLEAHDRIPEAFPKSSKSHPYKAPLSEIKSLKEETEPKLENCGKLLQWALNAISPTIQKDNLTPYEMTNQMANFNAGRQFFTDYNQACPRQVNIKQAFDNRAKELSCLYYRRSNNLPALERLPFLEKCGRDPWILNPNHFQGTISDCYTLNHFCQVRMANKDKEENPYCQIFKQGQCLSIKSAEIPNFFSPEVPFFWQTTKSAQTTIHTDYASCLIGENAVIEAGGYFLGKISSDGFLTLYHHGKILRNIAQFLPNGKLIKYSSKHPAPEAVKATLETLERKILESHFQRIKPILGNGILRECGKYNTQNNKDEINTALILTPQGQIIQASDHSPDRYLFNFEPIDITHMQQENQ